MATALCGVGLFAAAAWLWWGPAGAFAVLGGGLLPTGGLTAWWFADRYDVDADVEPTRMGAGGPRVNGEAPMRVPVPTGFMR